MPRTALDRAEQLFAAGRHLELISLLEPQVPVYRDSHRFYYLLGSACLRTGDGGGASAYLKRAEQLDPRDCDTKLALAALALRRSETEFAVQEYLGVLDDRPRDRLAKKALRILRKHGAPDRLASFVESGRMASLYPGPHRLPPIAFALAALVVIVLAITFAWPLFRSVLDAIALSRAPRPEVAALSLSPAERVDPVSTGGSFRYALTQDEALASFDKAKAYFQDYRDNAALVEINRLLGSNASASIKEKARALRLFAGAPDFRTLSDVPSFAALSADPELYAGCAVAWKGMAANVLSAKDGSSFDFLVGYEDKKKLEGIARAKASGLSVPVDRPLEILAVIATAEDTATLKVVTTLEVVAIHELQGGK